MRTSRGWSTSRSFLNDVLALRVVAYDDRHDGWLDQVASAPYILDNLYPLYGLPPPYPAEAPIVKKNVNTEDVWGGRAMLTFKPNNDFDATLIFKTETQDTGGSPISSPQFIPTLNAFAGTNYNPYYTQLDLDASVGHSETDQWILEMNYDLGFGKLTSETGYGSVTGSTVVVNPLEGEEVTHSSHAWDEELRLASNTNEDFSWIVGGYYRADDQKLDLATSGPPFALAPLSGDRELERPSSAKRTGISRRPGPQRSGSVMRCRQAPFRKSIPSRFRPRRARFTASSPNSPSATRRTKNRSITRRFPKASAPAAPISTNSLGTDPTFVGPFRPDTVWNYELGAKKTFLDDMLTVNGAVFYLDWNNVQIDHTIVSLISPPTSFITINGKDAHSVGVEGDVYFNPTPDWTITAGGDVLDARYDDGAITGVGGTYR